MTTKKNIKVKDKHLIMLLFLFFVSVEFKFDEKEIIIIENGNFFARFNVAQIKEDGGTDCFVLDCGQFGFQKFTRAIRIKTTIISTSTFSPK